MPINLNYTGPSGQNYFVAAIQRMSDLTFMSGTNGPFLTGLTFNQKQILLTEVAGMLGEYRVTLNNSAWIDSEYIYSVCDSGIQVVLGAQNFWTKSGIECGPSGLPYQVWDEPMSLHNTNGTFGSGQNKTVQDIYYADIRVLNNSPTNNEYGVVWFKNTILVSSGNITNPAISCFDCTNGNALFQNKVMSYASNLGALSYIEPTNKMVSGIPYEVRASGLIDGISQSWRGIKGLDLM